MGALFSISRTLASSDRLLLDGTRTDPWIPGAALAAARSVPETSNTTETPPPAAPQPATEDAPDAASVASADDTRPPIPAGEGELDPPPAASGHRIFVDGRVVSEGTDPFRVSCGTHSVRIGSAGRLQSVDVPCGGALALTR